MVSRKNAMAASLFATVLGCEELAMLICLQRAKFQSQFLGGAKAICNMFSNSAKILQTMLTGPFTGLAVQTCVSLSSGSQSVSLSLSLSLPLSLPLYPSLCLSLSLSLSVFLSLILFFSLCLFLSKCPTLNMWSLKATSLQQNSEWAPKVFPSTVSTKKPWSLGLGHTAVKHQVAKVSPIKDGYQMPCTFSVMKIGRAPSLGWVTKVQELWLWSSTLTPQPFPQLPLWHTMWQSSHVQPSRIFHGTQAQARQWDVILSIYMVYDLGVGLWFVSCDCHKCSSFQTFMGF